MMVSSSGHLGGINMRGSGGPLSLTTTSNSSGSRSSMGATDLRHHHNNLHHLQQQQHQQHHHQHHHHPSNLTLTAAPSAMSNNNVASSSSSAHSFSACDVELPKELVDFYLRNGKAKVVCESEKRTRSDVWKYFGRVKCISDGKLCKDVVACRGCNMVYLYRSKSQGTSTLRHHKCPYVFEVLGKDLIKREPRDLTINNTSSPNPFLHDAATAAVATAVAASLNMRPHGEGREMTPEGDEHKHMIPTPPPLSKAHTQGSPPPQTMPLGLVNSLGGRDSGVMSTPPPPAPQAAKDFSPQQLLCVRWGNYDSNIVSMFSKLRNQEQFVDLTLWCEGRTIKCHKMILSACSTYFENLLTETQNLHPIIFLKDMRFWEIQALVEFMYKGEVSIHQDKLQSLLRAAESLQIKGLGSPSNDIAGQGSNNSSVNDDEMSNSTVDMSTNATPNHRNNNSSYLASNNNMSMGMDLSNHGGSQSGLNLHNSSGSGIANKRRKKETPRRIDIPRSAGMQFDSPMRSDEMMDDDDAGSDDSMTAHERNNIDLNIIKHDNQDGNYAESNDGDHDHDNYGDQDDGNQSGDDSNDQNVDVDDEMEGALSLRMNVDRERSRKGNPIKKIQLGNNNNNNDTAGGTTILHHTASTGD